ncbi:MAG: YajQ family cyclic di-GMP-binding protein [Proteobacteria bacterium]|nr:YajQ family cyclic di-GMP-binding protein [Pseudomonadota bacterium]
MPSFDIVSKVDFGELENAVNNALREVATRYDFRNSKTTIDLDKKAKEIHLLTADSMKMRALEEMLRGNCVKRHVDPRCLDFGKEEPTSQGLLKRDVKIKEGVSQDTARGIVKTIKDLKLKVQASIQDDQVRVTGKKIDELQEVIQTLRAQKLEVPLQYVNMKA